MSTEFKIQSSTPSVEKGFIRLKYNGGGVSVPGDATISFTTYDINNFSLFSFSEDTNTVTILKSGSYTCKYNIIYRMYGGSLTSFSTEIYINTT